MNPSGKVMVVTGAGSGMGRQVALELLRRGAKVAAVDMNGATLAETVTLAGPGAAISTHVVNITDQAAVEALPAEVAAKHGAVDGVIHCAGIIQPFVKLAELSYADIDRVMNVNWRGTLYMTKTFLPVPGQTIYGASKAAVKLLTEGLNSEMKGTSVHVTVVFPGGVDTNITQNSGVAIPTMPSGGKQPKVTTAPAAAHQIVEGMVKNKYRVVVGSDASMLDKLYRLAPGFAAGFIAKQMKALLA